MLPAPARGHDAIKTALCTQLSGATPSPRIGMSDFGADPRRLGRS